MSGHGSQLKKCPKCGEIYFNAQAVCKNTNCGYVFYDVNERLKRMREKARRKRAAEERKKAKAALMKPIEKKNDRYIVSIAAADMGEKLVKDIASSSPYTSLIKTLNDAYVQAAEGKGKERHVVSENEKFEEQLICTIGKWGLSFAEGQAVKKIVEARVALTGEDSIAELLGAIVYLASEIIVRRESLK